jgi:fumarate reductase subunit D
VRFTSAHVVVIVLAALPAYIGIRVLEHGLFHRSYDNALVNSLVLGGMLILLAVTLVVFAVRDVRRRSPRR